MIQTEKENSFHATNTYTSQSIANNNETSVIGASMADKTTKSKTSAALGTDADDIDAAVDVNRIVINSPKPNVILAICAIKIDATDINNAVPSILTLHPIGNTNRVIRGSIRNLSFMQRNVIGSAAALQKQNESIHFKLFNKTRKIENFRRKKLRRSCCKCHQHRMYKSVVKFKWIFSHKYEINQLHYNPLVEEYTNCNC